MISSWLSRKARPGFGWVARCSACVLLELRKCGNLSRGGPRMPIWRNAMDWLGLGPDDAYDDYDATQEPERPSRSPRHQREEPAPRGQRGYQDYESDGTVRTMPARPSYPTRDADLTGRRPPPATDDSNVHPRPINAQRQAPPSSADPYTVRPRRFDSAQEVA